MLQASASTRTAARVQPFIRSTVLPLSRRCTRVLASSAGSQNGVVAVSPVVIPEWHTDKETIKDVFAFSGPAPERVNGRVAMYGFAGIFFTELTKHTPALEQFGEQWFTVLFFSVLITLGSLLPKLTSGISLQELHASATSQNMAGSGWKQILAFFDTNTELWVGRVAMIGTLGLVVAEVIKQDAFF